MAIHKSALKRARQNEKRYTANRALRSRLKTQVKKVLAEIEAKNTDAARAELTRAASLLQKAASKKVLHKRNASRKLSRLAKKVNAPAATS